MGACRRAAPAGKQERGQVLGLDLRQVPRQDSGRSTHALEHGPVQSRIDFLPQVDRETAQPLSAYLSPWHLLGGSSEKNLILAGACMDEGSGV